MAHRSPILVPLVALLSLGACAGDATGISNELIEELIASDLGTLAWATAWRSFVFGLLGLGLGLGLFFGLRARQVFRLDWRHAKWVRGLLGLAFALAFAGAGSWWGFWRGAVHGAEDMIRDGQLGTEALPMVGAAGSLMIASIYVGSELLDDEPNPSEAQLEALEQRVAAYARGEWAMDGEQLDARLARVRSQTIAIASDVALREIHVRYPELEGTLADELVPWALDKFSAKLSEKLIESASDSETAAMVAKPLQEVFAELDEAAAREGDDSMLAHTELRVHIVEVGLVPMLIGPVEHFAHGQQKTGLLALLLFVLVAVGGVRLADHQIARRKAAPPLPLSQ